MTKKPVVLDGLLNADTQPTETGVPQRGTRKRAQKPERRSDQMSIRMRPSVRAQIERLAEAEGEPIAEIIERAVMAYAKHA